MSSSFSSNFLSQKKKIFGFGSLHFSPLFGTSFSAFSTANFTKVTTQSNSNNSHESHLATPNQNNSSSSQPEQPLSLSVQYITKIKDHKQKGDYLGAVSIFEEMCSKGIKPDRFHYSIMIPIYTFLDDREGLFRIIDEIKKQKLLSEPIIFNQALLALSKLGKCTEAFQTFEEYVLTYKSKPEDKHIRTLVKMYLRQNAINELLRFFDFVCQYINKNFPDSSTLALIFSHFHRQSDLRNATLLVQKFGPSKIHKEKIVLRYLFKIYSNLGKVQLAEETFQNLPDKDVTDYNALLQLYVNKGQIQKMRSLLDQMTNNGIGFTLYTYNIILEGYTAIGDNKSIQQTLDKMTQEDIEFDQYTYNILIRHFVQFGDLSNAFKFLNKMKKEGLRPFPSTYINLLRLCSEYNNTEKFKELYNELIAMNYEPNQIALTTLLAAHYSHDDISNALRLFKSTKALNMNPNTTTYNSLLKILLSKHDYALMEDIFNEMHSNRLTPNLITLNLMLECYLKLRKDTQFLRMFEMINEFQIIPDSTTINLLLEFYLIQHNNEKFLEILRYHFDLPESITRVIDEVHQNQQRSSSIKQETNEDRESERKRQVDNKENGSGTKTQSSFHNVHEQQLISKLQPTVKTYNLLIKFFGLVHGHQKATEIFNILFEASQTNPLYPDNDTFNVLIEVLNPESVLYYWDYMRSKYHVIPNLSNFITMLQFCGRYNNVTLANSVLQRFFNSHLVGTLTLPWIYINNVLKANKHPVSKKLRVWFDKLVKDKFQQNSFILTKSETLEFERIVFLSKFKISESK